MVLRWIVRHKIGDELLAFSDRRYQVLVEAVVDADRQGRPEPRAFKTFDSLMTFAFIPR